MKKAGFLRGMIIAVCLLMLPAVPFASTGASIMYQETSLGEGLWQYDYTFHNTSDASEYLYGVFLSFGQVVNVTDSSLATGWSGAVWGNNGSTSFLDAMSTSYSSDIAAGDSRGGFTYTADFQLGSVPFIATFDDQSGNRSSITGTTVPVVPEPLSMILFVAGGSTLALSRRFRKKNQAG